LKKKDEKNNQRNETEQAVASSKTGLAQGEPGISGGDP